MKKIVLAVSIAAVCAVLFAFVNQPEKQKLEEKWFKYRTGEEGIPAPDAFNAKQASYYTLVGGDKYCGGTDEYCGIKAVPSDETSSALPIIGTEQQDEINNFFNAPGSYAGLLVDRTIE